MYNNKSSSKNTTKHVGPNPTLNKAVQFWDKNNPIPSELPQFLSRTNTKYATTPNSILIDRGISNRLLDSLLEGLPYGAYIAGGFLTSIIQEDDKAGDIDLFFNSEEAFLATYKLFAEGAQKPPENLTDDPEVFKPTPEGNDKLWAFHGWKISDETIPGQDAHKLRFVKFVHPKLPPVQLIKLVWYKNAEHVIDSFDLTIAQFATDGKNLVFNPVSFLDVARKRIVLHRMQFPASTIRRIVKYTSKGYYACAGALSKIAMGIHESIRDNPDGVEKVVYVD